MTKNNRWIFSTALSAVQNLRLRGIFSTVGNKKNRMELNVDWMVDGVSFVLPKLSNSLLF